VNTITRICPQCHSQNVEPDTTERTAYSHGNISDWICNNCGYTGPMPEKIDISTEKHRENTDKPEKQGKIDESGRNNTLVFLILFFIIFILPLLMLSLYLLQ